MLNFNIFQHQLHEPTNKSNGKMGRWQLAVNDLEQIMWFFHVIISIAAWLADTMALNELMLRMPRRMPRYMENTLLFHLLLALGDCAIGSCLSDG